MTLQWTRAQGLEDVKSSQRAEEGSTRTSLGSGTKSPLIRCGARICGRISYFNF